MLNVEQARGLVIAHARPRGEEGVALGQALGRVLATPIAARHDVPPFDSSAMDGFAAKAGAAKRVLSVVGDSRAGAPYTGILHAGEAVRISTGAPFPSGADGVLPVELTEPSGPGRVVFLDGLQAGENVRRAGGDVREGRSALARGVLIGPAEIGVAASCGHGALRCTCRPRVVILTTGDELVAPGRALGPGQIHDANLLTLGALVSGDGGEVLRAVHLPDTVAAVREAIARALQDADLLLLSGGVSVGPHDHVKPALAAQDVSELFWRVALRPGKPTWCGTHGSTLVLGLPGNPVSTMVTYLLFGRPAIRQMLGLNPHARVRRARLSEPWPRVATRDEMVRVSLNGEVATPTGAQDSHLLGSMLGADGLARIPAGEGQVEAGSEVDVELLWTAAPA